ncbi:GIY-YIG nuclease family protein [Marinibaculum pumilum]|uniref:GIY-YIG nuclease family protein n=1 Tax=Marinibaculum pumilum TaxID=1766165 RepID=A0ABV7L7Q5_9PROT
MKGGWVYILASRPQGTLYIGVTADLAARVLAHREGRGSGFAHYYGTRRLVYVERHEDIVRAIQREKNLKRWRRAWKIALIEAENPGWGDLWERLQV